MSFNEKMTGFYFAINSDK